MPEAVEVQAEVIMLQDLVPSEAFIVGVYAEKMDVDQFVTEVRGLAKDLPTDMEVPSARDTVRSFAYKVAQAKRRLDEYGKDMTRDARKLIESVNGTRKVVVGKLEALQDEVRAPLTAWEKAEEERKAAEEAEKARLEAERLAEIERQRQAELAEARRIAAEAEEARLKAEAEARRVAEEARLKAEAELAERRKALEEAARKHREELEQAQRKAREEAAEAERQRQAEIAEQRLAEKKRQEAEAKVRAEQERVAAEAARVEREAREAEAKAQREEIERMRKKLEEQEQARVKAEMEAQRKAEAEEKARLAAEVVEPTRESVEAFEAEVTEEARLKAEAEALRNFAPCDGVTARDQAAFDVFHLLAQFLCPESHGDRRTIAEAVVDAIIDDKVRHVRFDRLTA